MKKVNFIFSVSIYTIVIFVFFFFGLLPYLEKDEVIWFLPPYVIFYAIFVFIAFILMTEEGRAFYERLENDEFEKKKKTIKDLQHQVSICEELIKKSLNKNSNEEKVRSESDIAKEVLQILHELGGCDATDEWSKGWDEAIDTAYDEIKKRYNVEEDEE